LGRAIDADITGAMASTVYLGSGYDIMADRAVFSGSAIGHGATSMTRTLCLAAVSLALAFVVTNRGRFAIAGDAEKEVSLFNGKDLTGWYVFIRHADKSVDPYQDTEGVFKVEDGVIHISGEEFGCLTTKQEYSDYRLRLEVKWGTKKWPPRDSEKTPRDSGILMHCVGPDKVWTKSIECQIQEHDFGDFFLVAGTTIEVNGKVEKGRAIRTMDVEKPHGEWNVVEVVCDGDAITNIVNGVVVNKGTSASVRRGKIILQSEGAEVYYRNITLAPVK
jgi:hypothetical protein